jgi:Fe-S cluster assembly scaffold protein SufB
MSTTLTAKRTDLLLDAGVFSRADVDHLSTKLNEPDWLREQRQTAWSVFEETPLPTTADEAWRRTSLRKIKWSKFAITNTSSLRPANLSSANDASLAVADLPPDVLRN